MTTDNVTTWRDLADQLTPQQIERLSNGKHIQPDELLDFARDFANTNLLQMRMADVPDPAGATHATAWHYFGDDLVSRTVYGDRQRAGNCEVLLCGDQDGTGAVSWRVEVQHVEHTDGELTAVEARALAAALVAAADRLEELADEAWSAVPVCCSTVPCRCEPPFN